MSSSYPKLPFDLDNIKLFRNKAYVGGEWVDASDGRRFEVIDPGNGDSWTSVPLMTFRDVDNAVNKSHEAFIKYSKVNPRKRAQCLYKWDQLIRANKDDIARILVHETGKPLREAHGELEYSLGFTWWFAGEAERVRGTIAIPSAPGRRVFTIKQPIGVAAALVPWNFPIAMVLRKAGAALAAGCSMIIKPSPETPLTALTLCYLAEQAGFEPGVLSVLTTDLQNTPELSERLCRHALVKKVTFTGSTRVGRLIAAHCAEGLKKVTLELGGNCPVLVFDDADLEQAADQLMALKWRHAGQACITANRVYVQSGVYDKFVSLMASRTKELKIGHGMAEDTTMGPLTVPQGIDKALAHVEDAKKNGGRVLFGGNRIKIKNGYFFEPTMIVDAHQDLLVAKEEVFAPVAAFFKFETEAEAVGYANATNMGLASYFFTKNVDRTWRLLESLEAGMIGMNVGNASAAESPFGGIKESGYGKESGKDVAIDEYLITKTGTLSIADHF